MSPRLTEIVLGGGLGTLNEFTIACCEAKVIGVVDSEPGLTASIRSLISSNLPIRSKIIFNEKPERLLELCINTLSENI